MNYKVESTGLDGILIVDNGNVVLDTWDGAFNYMFFCEKLKLFADRFTDEDKEKLESFFSEIRSRA